MTRKRRRLYLIVSLLAALGVAAALVLNALDDSIAFFYTPGELAEKQIGPDRRIRLGGLVEEGSVERSGDDVTVSFRITDTVDSAPVRFRGLLPDLFREGQGVVAEGRLDASGTFVASEVLAKHDENYMPREVAEALKKSGQWKGDGNE